jgi:hypothetical protein
VIHSSWRALRGMVRVGTRVLGSLSALALPLAGQEVSGHLQTSASARPIAGVVVVASRADDGLLVARTLTGSGGEFRLAVTTDSLVVRALRIGQQPVVLAHVRLRAGSVHRVEMALPDRPVVLSVVRTLATDRCQLRTSDGDVVGELFFAARAAILAAGASAADGRSRSAYRLVSEQYNARGAQVDSLRQEEVQLTDALQPFRSRSADSLLADGWVSGQPDGGTVFRALDAEVLLDDRFLARYCLHLASDSSAAPGVIGVAFRPAESRRRRADVEGVLWLDRESYALRELEFRYTGLDAVSAGTNPGGIIEFASLPSGVWFVSGWSMRMPIVGQRVELRSGVRADAPPVISERRVLIGRRTLRADVLWVETEGRLQFMRPWPLTTDGARQLASTGDRTTDTFASSGVSNPCWLHGRLLTAGGTPLASATLEVFDHGRATPDEEPRLLDVTRTDSTGRFRLCPESGPRALLVRSHVATLGSDSVVVAAMNSERPHAIALMRGEHGFVVPPMHADQLISAVRASLVAVPARADAGVGESEAGVVAEGPTAQTARSTADRTSAGSAVLVVEDREGISVPFATVTIGGGERRVTGADGRVPLPGHALEELDVEVRRIGYVPFVGRVSSDANSGGYRVQLERAEQELGAVVVVAPRETGLSRTGFYDRAERVRRGAILGAFMTPEEIERRSFGHAGNLLNGLQYVWMGPGGVPGGRGGCRHQILVDGLPFRGSLTQIPASEVMGVEVYPSTANAPVELIPVTDRGSCGIVAIWIGPRR